MPKPDEHKNHRTQNPNWVEISTLIVLTITLCGVLWYTCEAHRQNNLTESSLGIMKEQMNIENRAWVTVVDVKRDEFKIGKETEITVSFANSGHTPAHNMNGFVYGLYWDKPNFGTSCLQSDKDEEVSTTILGPQSVNSQTMYTERKLTATDIELVKQGALRYYIWGYIYYNDIWGQRHFTEYCFINRIENTSFNSCESGNTMN